MRFFTEGDADRYVFSEKELPELKGVAEVISSDSSITASAIVTELEKRGVERLLVEGGASVLRMFLAEGMADTVRRAVNPQLTLGPERGGAQFRFEVPEGAVCRRENLGGMEVATCTLRPDTRDEGPPLPDAGRGRRTAVRAQPDLLLRRGRGGASRREELHGLHPRDFAHAPCRAGGDPQGARRGRRIARGGDLLLDGAVLCSGRASRRAHATDPAPRIARVVFALYEPDRFVCCRGAQTLREAGVDVRVYPELAEGVRRANAHLGR